MNTGSNKQQKNSELFPNSRQMNLYKSLLTFNVVLSGFSPSSVSIFHSYNSSFIRHDNSRRLKALRNYSNIRVRTELARRAPSLFEHLFLLVASRAQAESGLHLSDVLRNLPISQHGKQ